jgi:hypothetical protein
VHLVPVEGRSFELVFIEALRSSVPQSQVILGLLAAQWLAATRHCRWSPTEPL